MKKAQSSPISTVTKLAKKMLTVALALVAISAAAAQVTISPPIPMLVTDEGLRSPPTATARGRVRIDVFISSLCGDSAANLPELYAVTEVYGENQVELRVHNIPLPYHRNSFATAQVRYI